MGRTPKGIPGYPIPGDRGPGGGKRGKEKHVEKICPLLSINKEKEVECSDSCAWYQKSDAAKGGACAVLRICLDMVKMANK